MMRESVRILDEVQAVDLAWRQLGPFKCGDEVEVWSWEAKVLERRGLAERRRITPTDVRRLIIAEERNPNPEKLPENFYSKVRDEVLSLRESGDDEKADELKSQTLALLEVRLPKLLRFVFSPEDSKEVLPEERFLINRLAFVLNTWGRKLEKFLETGEEVDRGDSGGTI
jgi:hypothetical protein